MKKSLIVAALCSAFMAGPVFAQAYLGAGIGSARTDTHNTSGKIYGGFQFNPTWGIELGYTDLGKYKGANVESTTLSGVGTLPMGQNWSLFGKLGAASNQPHFGGAGRHSDVLLGIGLGYSINKNVSARLEFENFGKLSNVGGSNSNGRNLGLGLQYAF